MTTTYKQLEPEINKTSPFEKWGLIPSSYKNQQRDIKNVLHHFFVEFNPLYLFSVLCVFYGVFLISNNLDVIDKTTSFSGQIILFFVLQAYEATIITGIAFLVFKTQAIRPAIILCLLECTLIFDCTFRLENLSLSGNIGILLFGLWFLLVLVKTWAIAKIMHLEMTWIHYSSIAAVAASLALIIELFSQTWANKTLLLQITAWIGSLVLLVFIVKRPNIISKLAISGDNKETAEKCINAGFTILAGFYFYHTLAFLFFAVDPSITAKLIIPQFATITLLLTITNTKAYDIIKCAILTIILGLTATIGTAYACFILAAVVMYHVSKGLHTNHLIVAAFLFYTGYWLIGWDSMASPLPLPELISIPTFMFGLSLILIAIIFKNIIAISMITIAVAYIGFNSIESILPSSALNQGILIIASGFLMLISGLAINWFLKFDHTESVQ